jgi:GTP-binding protein
MSKAFLAKMQEQGVEVFIISAATGEGVGKLMNRTAELVKKLPDADISEVTDEIKEYVVKKESPFNVIKVEDYYVVEGKQAMKLVESANLDDYESLGYFQRRLRNLGVIDQLKEAGVKEGDTVCIGDFEFNYME